MVSWLLSPTAFWYPANSLVLLYPPLLTSSINFHLFPACCFPLHCVLMHSGWYSFRLTIVLPGCPSYFQLFPKVFLFFLYYIRNVLVIHSVNPHFVISQNLYLKNLPSNLLSLFRKIYATQLYSMTQLYTPHTQHFTNRLSYHQIRVTAK